MLSHVWFFVTPWTVAHQASLSMEYSRQEYWSGLPFPSPGDLPHPGIKHQKKNLLHCRQILYHLSHQGSPIANTEVSLKEWKKKTVFFFPVAFSSLHPAHLCKTHLSKQSTFTLELCWKLCGGFLFPMLECKHYRAPPRGPRNLAPSYLLKLSPPPHSQPSPCWVPLLSSWTQFPWRPRSSLQPDGGVPMRGELGDSCEAPNVAIITPLNDFLCVTLSSLVKG